MRIDLHVHTAPRSRCSVLDPEEAIRVARARGLDGICFTEHNRLWEARALKELADRHGFPVLQGVEVDTPGGHVLVYGLEELPTGGLDLRQLRRQVEEAGGVMVAAHPFRRPMYATGGYGLWSLAAIPVEVAARREVFRWVDAIEVSNGREEETQLALAVSQRLALPALGGSDAHRPKEVGASVTLFEGTLTTGADLVRALKEGRYRLPPPAGGSKGGVGHGSS